MRALSLCFFARFFLDVISRKMTRRELEDLKFVRSLAEIFI